MLDDETTTQEEVSRVEQFSYIDISLAVLQLHGCHHHCKRSQPFFVVLNYYVCLEGSVSFHERERT
jgi:hypothetical protein